MTTINIVFEEPGSSDSRENLFVLEVNLSLMQSIVMILQIKP